jgi:hypothetical protein
MEASFWREQVAGMLRGQRVLLFGGPLAAWTARVAELTELGVSSVAVLATEGDGVGALPSPEAARRVVLDCRRAPILETMRASAALLADLPTAAVQFVDEVDPTVVIGTFLNELPALAGRTVLAHRRPEWLVLEDKIVIDAFWDRAGIERVASEVVDASNATRVDAVRRALDGGAGTVLAGDAREGFNGGAEYTRLVVTDDDRDEAMAFFAAHCDRVRVMPYLDGIPCSVHGIVFPDHVVALRPIEMVVHQRPTAPRLRYGGCATWWDPHPDDRDEMRTIARRVGAQLRDEVDFRGAFTVDGIMTVDGFRPTELNPRMGAGLNTMLRGIDELPLQLVLDALVGGIELDYHPAELETLIVATGDANRAGGTWSVVSAQVPTIDDGRLALDADGAVRWAAPDERGAGTVAAGSSPQRSFVRCLFDAGALPIGASVGPPAAAFWAFADRELGTSVGPLEPARSVR